MDSTSANRQLGSLSSEPKRNRRAAARWFAMSVLVFSLALALARGLGLIQTLKSAGLLLLGPAALWIDAYGNRDSGPGALFILFPTTVLAGIPLVVALASGNRIGSAAAGFLWVGVTFATFSAIYI